MKSPAAEHSPAAFGDVVLRYQDRIYNLAYRMMHDPDKAQDITQEAFTQAYRQLDRFRGNSSIYTWLYRIALNLCRAEYRRRHAKLRPNFVPLTSHLNGDGHGNRDLTTDQTGPVDDLEAKERHDFVRRAVARLSPSLREVSVLRDMEGLSYDEVAEVLDIPVGTVRSRLHRARNLLRQDLRQRLQLEP